MAHRSFAQIVEESPAKTKEVVSFDLADEKNIICRRRTNGKLLMSLVAKVDSTDTSIQVEGVLGVFDITVLPTDGESPDKYTGRQLQDHTDAEIEIAEENGVIPGVDPTSSLGRLDRVINDPNTEIDIDELAALVGWLVEQYVGRPTASAAQSPRGVSAMRGTSQRARRTRGSVTPMPMQDGSSTSSTGS